MQDWHALTGPLVPFLGSVGWGRGSITRRAGMTAHVCLSFLGINGWVDVSSDRAGHKGTSLTRHSTRKSCICDLVFTGLSLTKIVSDSPFVFVAGAEGAASPRALSRQRTPGQGAPPPPSNPRHEGVSACRYTAEGLRGPYLRQGLTRRPRSPAHLGRLPYRAPPPAGAVRVRPPAPQARSCRRACPLSAHSRRGGFIVAASIPFPLAPAPPATGSVEMRRRLSRSIGGPHRTVLPLIGTAPRGSGLSAPGHASTGCDRRSRKPKRRMIDEKDAIEEPAGLRGLCGRR